MGTILGIHVTIDTENQVKFVSDMEWIDKLITHLMNLKKINFMNQFPLFLASKKKI